MSEPPVVLEPKTTTRYLLQLLGVALLCGGGLTWMARSCTGSAPRLQTTGADLLASLDSADGKLLLRLRNQTSAPLHIVEPAWGYSVFAEFYNGSGEPAKVHTKIAINRPKLEARVLTLAPGEEAEYEVERSSIARQYDVRPFTWVAFIYAPSDWATQAKTKDTLYRGRVQSNPLPW